MNGYCGRKKVNEKGIVDDSVVTTLHTQETSGTQFAQVDR